MLVKGKLFLLIRTNQTSRLVFLTQAKAPGHPDQICAVNKGSQGEWEVDTCRPMMVRYSWYIGVTK